jgi:hypothetical protein
MLYYAYRQTILIYILAGGAVICLLSGLFD